MPEIATESLHSSLSGYTVAEKLQIYNGLDCCVTLEVYEELDTIPQDAQADLIYNFERGLQAPALEMMLRGFRVDESERRNALEYLHEVQTRLYHVLDRLAHATWDKPLNPRSSQQLVQFFYKWMGLPEQWTSVKGVKKLSMGVETLEKLEVYFHARPVIATILAIRKNEKLVQVLKSEVDPDHRMRTSYNVAGTETGRWSSSKNAYGGGTNLQNITPRLRRMFIADPGKKLGVIDLEQAESRLVGLLCGLIMDDWRYLDACEAGDLHTAVAQMIWPDLPWIQDLKANRKIADKAFYHEMTYRDMAKRGGHGTNYYGTPFTMARHLKVRTKLVEDFQNGYFENFPGIVAWHKYVAKELQTKQFLTTPLGRTRHFFGRPNDDATLREAIAYVPQSSVGDIMNLGLWRLWFYMGDEIELIGQVHDAVIFQYPESADEVSIVTRALKMIEVDLAIPGRKFIIPGEAKVGWNWGYADEKNPDGLIKLKGRDSRTRTSFLNTIQH